jgi:hypothetical protein
MIPLPRTSETAAGIDNKIATKYPGMRTIAGPYGVNSMLDNVAKSERASCVRAHKEQGAGAKIIMVGKFAWVIRPAAGWIQGDQEAYRQRYKSTTNIKGGRMAK